MNSWLHNPIFPNLLYKRINTKEEYLSSILMLKDVFHITNSFYGESYDTELYPLDEVEWTEYFLKPNSDFNTITLESLISKPLEEEYPLILNFSVNHKYLFWTALKDFAE